MISHGPPPHRAVIAGTFTPSTTGKWLISGRYANHQQLCNPLYNIMYQAGVPLRHMRICEPFGPEQRQGLWLYHVIEPDRWAAMCARVSGVKVAAFTPDMIIILWSSENPQARTFRLARICIIAAQ
ncbi:hypothetical protein DMN57_21105 [Escherichia coli]|nr:hypothetical protein [Escherichia coli]